MKVHEHNLEDREDGLALCLTCGGAEGAMPTMCPGVRLTAEQLEDIYADKLDFNRGPMAIYPHWWSTV